MASTNRKTFTVSHSELTRATPTRIWALWSDVNRWPDWDVGLASCELEQPFSPGSTFLLRPLGAEHPITVEIQETVANRTFSDLSRLPFGEIKAIHEVEETAEGTRLTHTIIAEINEEQAGFFAGAIWANMESGVPQAVKNLVGLAEAG